MRRIAKYMLELLLLSLPGLFETLNSETSIFSMRRWDEIYTLKCVFTFKFGMSKLRIESPSDYCH